MAKRNEVTIKFDPKQMDEIMKKITAIEDYVNKEIQEIREEIRKK